MKESPKLAFSRAAAKPEGSSGTDFLEAILRERPDLKDEMAYFPKQGNCAHTVIIGDEVFKGPNEDWTVSGFDKEWAVSCFDKEHETLKALEGKGLPIPRVTYIGKECLFFGMTRIPGIELSGVNLTEDEERALSKDIVEFIIGMARALPLKGGQFAIHNDLHEGNIMIDPETKRLSGIIDFGIIEYYEKCSWSPYYRYSYTLKRKLRDEFDLRKSEIPDAPAAAKQSPAGLQP